MSKNVLVISSTLRNNGNSEILAHEFAKGAKDSGNNVEFITLKDKEIKFCKGCLACQKSGHCVINDDSIEITKKMQNADVIAFASPIYYYEMSGLLKTMLDRANALYELPCKFKDIYFLSAAADTNKNAANTAIQGIKGWISCFDGVEFKGSVLAAGTNAPGEAENSQAQKQAYKMGQGV